MTVLTVASTTDNFACSRSRSHSCLRRLDGGLFLWRDLSADESQPMCVRCTMLPFTFPTKAISILIEEASTGANMPTYGLQQRYRLHPFRDTWNPSSQASKNDKIRTALQCRGLPLAGTCGSASVRECSSKRFKRRFDEK